MNSITEKINRNLSNIIYKMLGNSKLYWKIFPCYWNLIFKGKKNKNENVEQFIVSGINYGAGFTHQLSCWKSGYFMAQYLGMSFCTKNFFINGNHAEDSDKNIIFNFCNITIFKPRDTWGELLGVHEGEVTEVELRNRGYRCIRLPRFDFYDEKERNLIISIIDAYKGRRVYFQLGIDQAFIPNVNDISKLYRSKFWKAKAREFDKLEFDNNYINVVIHIRRGDVNIIDFPERYLSDEYYKNALEVVMNDIDGKSNVKIYVLSEGKESDFPQYLGKDNIRLCLDWDAKKSFLHMIYADYIIVGLSGFSVDAASISNAKRYAPINSFRKYPDNLEWIYLDNSTGKRI